MIRIRRLRSNQRGAATIEMAFALPTMVVMIWAFVQLAQVYRAMAGIQQALGEGARYATLCLNPTSTGCTIPTSSVISGKVSAAVYGIGPGTFVVTTPTCTENTTIGGAYYDLKVSYSQATNLLMFPGPTINVSRSKRVWIATSKCPTA